MIDILIWKNRLVDNLLARKSLNDIPAGDTRHLMFSRGGGQDVISRINQVIVRFENSQ